MIRMVARLAAGVIGGAGRAVVGHLMPGVTGVARGGGDACGCPPRRNDRSRQGRRPGDGRRTAVGVVVADLYASLPFGPDAP